MESGTTPHRRLDRYRTAAALVLIALAASCGNSRDANQGDETVPRIEPTSAQSTSAAPTDPPTTSAPPTTSPPTNPPTAPPPPNPWPTSATLPPTPAPTQPPATQPPPTPPPPTPPPPTPPPPTPPPPTPPPPTPPPPTPPPATQPPAIQAPPPTQPPATQPPATAAPTAPTTTVVVSPSTPRPCDAAAIGVDTGLLTIAGVNCNAGWAIGQDSTCPATQECDGVDVFHLTGSGWVHDGYFPASCAEGLTGSGMSIYTAATFVPSLCTGDPGATEIIRPDSTGERVVQLQIALIAEGYPIVADGTYGPRTQAAVRDFQSRNGLEVDGIAGPRTQAALGIGPGGDPPASETTQPPTTTLTTLAAVTTSTVAGPGQPAECSAAAIGADVGRTVDEISVCHSGWALGQIRSCPANSACPRVDVFHVTGTGWVHDGSAPAGCAEDLQDAGMSAYTAGDFTAWCGVPNLPVDRLVIEPGSTGIVVEQLQIALVALGYPIAVDGTYGPGTEAAVRDFQERNALEVDGIAGPRTRELLGL